MNNRRKKALLLIAVLSIAGLGLATSGRASTESGVEAVAVIEVTSGYTTTYNVGLSFANKSDCTTQAMQLNMMLNNLLAQGVSLGGKPIKIACEQSQSIQPIGKN
jgi:hypothetical protein